MPLLREAKGTTCRDPKHHTSISIGVARKYGVVKAR